MTTRTSMSGSYTKYITETTTCFGSYPILCHNDYHSYEHEGANTLAYYRKVKGKELIPFNPFFRKEEEGSFTGSGYWKRISNGCEWWTPGPHATYKVRPTMNQINEWKSSVDTARLMQAAYSSLNADFDAGTFLAELKDLPRLFIGLAGRLLQLLKRFKHEFSNSWLEYRYAWLPLLSDAQAIASLVQRANKREPEFVRRQARYGFNTHVAEPTDHRSVVQGDMWWSLSHTIDVRARATVISKIQPPKVLLDPLVTAWELVTLSFILDWVIGVGLSLQALAAFRHHPDAVSGYGYEIGIASVGKMTSSPKPDFDGYHTMNSLVLTTVAERQPMGVSFTPRVSWNIDLTRALDLLALLRQRI